MRKFGLYIGLIQAVHALEFCSYLSLTWVMNIRFYGSHTFALGSMCIYTPSTPHREGASPTPVEVGLASSSKG